MCKTIAVYGTLRYGASANRFMKGCKYLGNDAIYGDLYNLGAFPGLKTCTEKDGRKVIVDLYELPEDDREVLGRLDRYEGYYQDAPDQSLYKRIKVLTINSNIEVWAYEFCSDIPSSTIITSGDWFDHD